MKLFMVILFFACYDHHRDLHSFPTRRSSDLSKSSPPWNTGSSSGTACSDFTSSSRNSRAPRSEEHTSELQSHSDLVCRLLLEKKKTLRFFVTHTFRYFRLKDFLRMEYARSDG